MLILTFQTGEIHFWRNEVHEIHSGYEEPIKISYVIELHPMIFLSLTRQGNGLSHSHGS